MDKNEIKKHRAIDRQVASQLRKAKRRVEAAHKAIGKLPASKADESNRIADCRKETIRRKDDAEARHARTAEKDFARTIPAPHPVKPRVRPLAPDDTNRL